MGAGQAEIFHFASGALSGRGSNSRDDVHRAPRRGNGGRPYRAVVPEISGRAWITGIANYVLEEDDAFPEGFTVGDIW